MADMIRLAGDGMSWEDTLRHIDEALAAGEPEDTSDYSTDYYHEPDDDVNDDDEFERMDHYHDKWFDQLPESHKRWVQETNDEAMLFDFQRYYDHHANEGAPYTLTPLPEHEKLRQQRAYMKRMRQLEPYLDQYRNPEGGGHTARLAGLDMADIVRLAGDGMSWEDTMAYIDRVLAEGEPGTDEGRLPETESLLYEDYRNGPIPEQVQHEVGQCRNCGKSVIKQLGTGRWLDLWHFSPACGTAGTTENPRGRLLLHEADIVRLAGDGMSWEDTLKHIDQVLAEGEPEKHHDWDSDYSVAEPGVEQLNPIPLDHSGDGLQCDQCGGRACNDYEVNHISVGDDYKGKFCDFCLRNLVPSWHGHTASRRTASDRNE